MTISLRMPAVYHVKFYKKPEKSRDKAVFLGFVEIDEESPDPRLTITAKAFRQAPPKCLAADRVVVERIC